MVGQEFLEAVVAHPQLHLGRGPRTDRIYVVYTGPDRLRMGWELEPPTIHTHSWERLEAVLTGRQRAQRLMQISRIVGYYSYLSNWNPSKLAERADRSRGHYDVEPAIRAPDASFTRDLPDGTVRTHAHTSADRTVCMTAALSARRSSSTKHRVTRTDASWAGATTVHAPVTFGTDVASAE